MRPELLWPPAVGRLLRYAGGRVRSVVAISNAVALDVAKVLPGIPVATVPNAIDLDRFSPGAGDGEELDRRAGLPAAHAGTLRVGLVATYARWKGQLALLHAAARLASALLPVRWYVVVGPIYHTAAQFTEAARRTAESRFNSTQYGARLMARYHSLLENPAWDDRRDWERSDFSCATRIHRTPRLCSGRKSWKDNKSDCFMPKSR